MSDELKACPFCGVSRVSAWVGIVQCDACRGAIAGDSQCESIAAWNRRVVTKEQVMAMADELRAWFIDPRHRAHDTALDMLRAAGFEVAE